jgi:hypothetical protein
MIDVAQIAIPATVRARLAHVRNLAGSIALRGLRVPAIVRPDGAAFEMISSFPRPLHALNAPH